MNVQGRALWAGWAGTALSIVSWLAMWWISAVSFGLWVALMAGGAGLCGYGAVRRSRWFWGPAILTILTTAGAVLAAWSPER